MPPTGTNAQILNKPANHVAATTRSASTAAQRFNVGVLGIGRIGQMHMGNILKNRRINISWVLDEIPELWPAVRDRFYLNDTPFYSSAKYDELLTDSSLDAVMIFTSTPTHTSLVCKALENGKAVFCEKPVGENREDIAKCFDTAKKYGRPLLVGYMRRFDYTMSEAVKKVQDGAIGKVHHMRFVTRDAPKPSYEFLRSCDTTGCNILADLCVHDVDQLVYITKAERPEHIYVTTHAHDEVMQEIGEADAIGIVIKYKSGAIVTMDADRESVYGYDSNFEIFGEAGRITAENPRDTATVIETMESSTRSPIPISYPQRYGQAYRAEIDHFVECLEGKTQPLITKEQNLLVSEIVEKGLESFQTKKPAYF